MRTLADLLLESEARFGDRPALAMYPAGTWGPPAADKLIQQDGREWHRP